MFAGRSLHTHFGIQRLANQGAGQRRINADQTQLQIQFIRANSAGLYTMEVEAQTANAADVSQYEAALRTAPEFAGIETRDLRSREGVTTFVLTVIFKPESLRQGAGS